MRQPRSVVRPALAPSPRADARWRRAPTNASGVCAPLAESDCAAACAAAVFVHGNPGASADRHAPGMAPDMPGFGRTSKPAGCPSSVASYARPVRRALKLLDSTRAHLVRHDGVGPRGPAFAAVQPESIGSLILMRCAQQEVAR